MKTATRIARCLVVVSPLLLSGCGMGYMEYMQRTCSPNINSCTSTRYHSQNNYQVLGTVEAQGEATCILGLVVQGKMGQGMLWDQAQSRYAGGFTGIKDICAVNEFQGILPPIYAQIRTTYVGTVVREAAGAAGPTQPPQTPANP
ncbi:MAG: hypothetical protein ACLF0G_08795 [Candidatus Brocadiia bacterium]